MGRKIELENTKFHKTDVIVCAALVLVLAIFEIFNFVYMDRNLDSLIDSDLSGEMILSEQLNREGRILSEEWYYTTEIRFINTQLIYAPMFNVSDDWHVVHICSIVVLNLILLAASLFLNKFLDLGIYSLPISMCAILPFSKDYFINTIFGGYYVPHIVISFAAAGLLFLFVRTRGAGKIACLFVSVVLSVLAGMGGPRQLAIFYGPAGVAAAIMVLLDWIKTKKFFGEKPSRDIFISAAFSGAGSIAGFLINSIVLSKHYSFQNWNSDLVSEFTVSKMLTTLKSFFVTFGFPFEENDFKAPVTCVLSVLIVLVLAAAIIYGISHRGKVATEYSFLSLFLVIAGVIFVLIYSFFPEPYFYTRYNQPFMVFAISEIALFIKSVAAKDLVRKVLTVCEVGIFLVASFFGLKSVSLQIANPNQFAMIADFALNNGYSAGYATFWNNNVLTELTDGNVDMHCFSEAAEPQYISVTSDIDATIKWLEPKRHDYEIPSGKVFILLSDEEYIYCNWRYSLMVDYEVFSTDDYIVYGFINHDEMISALSSYDIDFVDYPYIENGEDIGGVRTLHDGGYSFGPYVKLYQGTYEVTIEGSGIQNTVISCSGEKGQVKFECETVENCDERIVLRFDCADDVTDCEVYILNISGADITISDIRIERVL